jgi:hypothetical protein
MDVGKLTAIVSLILALSIASERLVEIVKGWIPFLGKEQADPVLEGRRKSILQLLAVASGIVTALLSADYLPSEIAKPQAGWQIIGLGLLASGGFWLLECDLDLHAQAEGSQEAGSRKQEVEDRGRSCDA